MNDRPTNRVNAGPPQPRQGFDDQREAISKVVARPAVEPHPCAVLAGNDPETVVLGSGEATSPTADMFGPGLGETGYVEGRNVAIESRFADGHIVHLPLLSVILFLKCVL
jgi:hypothetical protein